MTSEEAAMVRQLELIDTFLATGREEFTFEEAKAALPNLQRRRLGNKSGARKLASRKR